MMDVSAFLMKIYPAIQMALFYTLTQLVSLQLKAIRKRVLALILVESQSSELIALRRHHRLICRTVRKLNRYFGIFLSIEVGYIFVISITSSLYILLSGMNIDGLLEALNVSVWLDVLVHLYLLASSSDDIVNQVLYQLHSPIF